MQIGPLPKAFRVLIFYHKMKIKTLVDRLEFIDETMEQLDEQNRRIAGANRP